jgi:hypothetical protein
MLDAEEVLAVGNDFLIEEELGASYLPHKRDL